MIKINKMKSLNLKKIFWIIILVHCSFTLPAQDSKTILVTLGSNSCSTTATQPYISLIDKITNNVLINCNVSSAIGNTINGVMVEYNPVDNFIYLISVTNGTKIWKFDVGLASSTFTCPTLTSTPTYSYSYQPNLFAINNYGEVYSIGNYNSTAATATLSKFNFSTGAVISSQTIQFPTTNKPSDTSSGDMTFVSNGKVYGVFGTSPSKLYELTNVGGTGNAGATFLTNITDPIYGLAYIDEKLQLSGYSGSSCYTYTYNLLTNTLGSKSSFPNGYKPVDHSSIYTSIGATKRILKKETINNSTADITYELHLQNTGNVKLSNVQITDNLAAIYGAANISNLTVTAVSNPSNLSLNPSFNGNTSINLLMPNQGLTNAIPNNLITLNLSMRINNLDTTQTYGNQATVTGYVGTSTNNITVSDLSNDGPPSAMFPLGTNIITNFNFNGYCFKKPVSSTTTIPTRHGITALGRAGADNGNWPMVRQSAWTVLEAKTKGFVVNRVANPATDIANPVEGMMVFDTTAQCLKIYNGTGWSCYSKPACLN